VPDLTFSIEQQKRAQWCWAATAVSILRFYGDQRYPQQCDLVNEVFGPVLAGQDCCQDAELCDTPWPLDEVLNDHGHLDQSDGVLAFGDVNQALINGRPVAVRIALPGFASAHFVVLTGCAESDDGTQWIKVADPSGSSGNVTSLLYSTLLDDYKPGAVWDQSYLTK
jgi:hypothetical protein